MEQIRPEEKEIMTWVSEQMPQLVRDLSRICRIPSVAQVGEEKKPPFGTECVRVLEEMLQIGTEYGLEAKNFDSCVGRIRYGTEEKSIGIWSHLDVVEAKEDWCYSPYEPVVEQGYLIARGCQDNKSSAVMALYVLLYMKEHGLKLPYSLDAYMGTCEEQGMYDLDYFTAHYPCPALSLVPDSGFPVCCGERGAFNGELRSVKKLGGQLVQLWCDCGLYQVPDTAYAVVRDCPEMEALKEHADVELSEAENGWKITCRGTAAHAAAPENGKNALTSLLELLAGCGLADREDCELLSFAAELNREGHGSALDVYCEDSLSGPIVLTATQGRLEDGHLVIGFISKYPVTCGDFAVRERAEAAAAKNGFELHVTRYAKPSVFDPGHPAVAVMTETYNRITGNHAEPFVMSGGTYARKLPRAFACGTGMPLAPAPEGLFLPGHGDYHQPDESVSLERIEKALVIYISGILQICRTVDL